MSESITYAQLKENLHYDPDTGIWTWLKKQSNHSPNIGELAGTWSDKGYLRITFKRRNYFAHRLAWLYMTGEWPKDQIDHIDLNKNNNKWNNYREATGSQNRGNIMAQTNNTSGFKGVIKRSNGFEVNFRRKYLGIYKIAEEAHEVYKLAAQEFYGKFARY